MCYSSQSRSKEKIGHNIKIPQNFVKKIYFLKIIDYSQQTKPVGILSAISQDNYLAYQVLKMLYSFVDR
ncbi:unnamed protein product [Paramecium pentaurelia]|uniref:Uncharacterized protein n=1 Tax=Paramecium pentaurelia TaxID=43138 RepID=A0A8S1VY60_9CILI|nr:unnamed protein product [Paramecium pentaurelia]